MYDETYGPISILDSGPKVDKDLIDYWMLPQKIRAFIFSNGVDMVLSEEKTAYNLRPYSRVGMDVVLRGAEHTTEGFYSDDINEIVIGHGVPSQWEGWDHPCSLMYHEVGHVIDRFMGYPSRWDRDFALAVGKDLKNLNDWVKHEYQYGDTAFASGEIFAWAVNDFMYDKIYLECYHPNVYPILKRIMEKVI